MSYRRCHFSIGTVNVSIRSDCRWHANAYLSLYERYRRDSLNGDVIEVDIKKKHNHRFAWRRGPFTIGSNGMQGFEVLHSRDILPHLEWHINLQVIRNRHEYVQIHAASLEIDGKGLILPGYPGSGKSTLCAGLLARDWSYFCDEFALIDPSTRMLHPFPRALCMKEASFPVVDRLGLHMSRKTPYQKAAKGRVAFLNPLDIRSDVVGRPCSVRWVVFPNYVANATPTLHPMTRSRAAYELARQCFNFRNDKANAMDVVADVVRGADCYQLVAGDIDSTCDLIESLRLPLASRKVG